MKVEPDIRLQFTIIVISSSTIFFSWLIQNLRDLITVFALSIPVAIKTNDHASKFTL